ncbi:uncharacterized protein LOC129907102 [Episyrphus balteatus]|uniref:uncharacterized protein LOC129907102 n=1 Tax=Episyrphus balteatus TaxID=286459 RepID=UPI0024855FF5|nr:uncharacterized protein LOC129907102 [Episyrphus balteatus]
MVGTFRVDYANIRGLRSNFCDVYNVHVQNRPAKQALGETQISENSDCSEFNVNGYYLVPLFFSHHGLAIYIRNDVAYKLQPQYGLCVNTNFNFMWLKFTVNKRIIHTCFIYRSPNLDSNSTSNEFDALSDSIQRIVSLYPHTEIVITGDFNVHNSSWLRYFGQTTPEGRYVEIFAELNHLTQLVDKPTRISDVVGQAENTLDLFLTSDPDKYTVSVLSPLVKEKSPKRTVWQYEKSNWDNRLSTKIVYRNMGHILSVAD